MKRVIKSFSDFKQYINQSLKSKSAVPQVYGKYVADTVSSLSTLMKTCKGRGKICSLIQYTATLYYYCNKYSQIQLVRDRFVEGLSVSVNIALKTKQSMRSARKVFRFLKFIQMISSMINLLSSEKPFYLVLVKFIGLIVSIINNIVDNLLWGIYIGVLSSVIDQPTFKKWKSLKYSTDLLNIIFKLLYYSFQFQIKNKQMNEILMSLKDKSEDVIEEDSLSHIMCIKYLECRREVRFEVFGTVIMGLRIMMLIKRLRLPGYQHINPVFYSFCGFVASILSVIKLLLEKPMLVKIKNKQDDLTTEAIIKKQKEREKERQKEREIENQEDESLRYANTRVRRVTFSRQRIQFQGIDQIENQESSAGIKEEE